MFEIQLLFCSTLMDSCDSLHTAVIKIDTQIVACELNEWNLLYCTNDLVCHLFVSYNGKCLYFITAYGSI